LFAPTLFLGGLLGALLGAGFSALHHLGEWVPSFPGDAKVIGGCVLLGMGAMFAAVVRCPFTSLIIIFEMTGNYSLILPLMAGNVIAWQLAKRWQPVSIYNALLLQDGINLRRLPAYRGAQDYRNLPVETIMTRDAFALDAEETVAAAISRIREANAFYHGYPVLSAEGRLAGVITYHELRENAGNRQVVDLLDGQDLLVVRVDTSIHDAANRMIDRDFQQVPVVEADVPDRLVGWLTLNDIARQQNAVEL
jgi:CIC family chloride channel protein